MKNYIRRLTSNAKTGEIIFWWILRVLMIVALIDSLFFKKNPEQVAQTCASFVPMFLWEVFMMFPEKRWMRHIPSYVQNFLASGLFIGSFGGAYLNFYYSVPAYDLIMHAIGGVACTMAGYEILTAMQKRDKVTCSVPIIILGAFGFSFFAGTGWELFEFSFDQLAGGDSQHWSLALAQEASNENGIGLPNFIPELDTMRYALMDTMEDTICNTVGGAIGWIILKIFPYHHMKNHNVNDLYKVPENAVKVAAMK